LPFDLRTGDSSLTWHPKEYIEVAFELKLITAEIATAARLTKDFRNLIHPGAAQRTQQECTQARLCGHWLRYIT